MRVCLGLGGMRKVSTMGATEFVLEVNEYIPKLVNGWVLVNTPNLLNC